MKEINGQFIMEGCASDDPNCLDAPEQLVALLRTVGFLPLFSNAIPGFSVEEHVPADRWWTDEESDPWAWRHMLADHPEIAYGKFFNKKAGFLHKDWFPVFASYRRNGYDFDALCDDELAPYKWKNAMSQFFLDDRLVGKVLPASDIKDETIKTDLQMRTYLIIMGFTQKRNKKGQPYGWQLASLGTPETKWGYDFVTSAYSMSPQDCWETIRRHMTKLYPAASDDALWQLLGMRILGAKTPTDTVPANAEEKRPGRKPRPRPTPPDKAYPGNLITKIDSKIPLPITEDQFAGLRYAISTLKSREQEMLRLIFEEGRTLKSIGESYGITSQRVRQIVARGIMKLRHPSRLTYIWLGLDATNRQRKEEKRTSVFPIGALGLSIGTINALVSRGLDTIAKVSDAIVSKPEKFRDFQYGPALELVKAFDKHGVEFDCQPEYAALLLREGKSPPLKHAAPQADDKKENDT